MSSTLERKLKERRGAADPLARKLEGIKLTPAILEDFKLTVTIIQGRNLAGQDIDPYVEVGVGEFKKRTKTKKGVNDPVYEESFAMDFVMPSTVFFDQVITINATSARRFLKRPKHIGSFKVDIATVFEQPEHMFFHKWALLINPLDPLSGPKGYICCDIIVAKKGEFRRTPLQAVDTDIDANLLLPDSIAETIADRQPARFIIGIHQAEDLPNRGKGGTPKGHDPSLIRQTAGASLPHRANLVDTYVTASFAGQIAKTHIPKERTKNPVWCQKIIFTELFPPLVRTIRLHVNDASGETVATAFLDLNHMSDNSSDGYMPTFGPAYVNLYGSLRDASGLTLSNLGLTEGIAYRGRLLVSVRVEMADYVTNKGLKNVIVKECLPLPDNVAGRKEEYFLFGCMLSCDMIDNKLARKELSLEMSVGNYGSELDGFKSMGLTSPQKDEDALSISTVTSASTMSSTVIMPGARWYSRTAPMLPEKCDNNYCFLPFGAKKPCLSVFSSWEDQRGRLYQVTLLKRLIKKYESLLTDSLRLVEVNQKHHAVTHYKTSLRKLVSFTNEYRSCAEGEETGSPYETPLDTERRTQRSTTMDTILKKIAKLKPTVKEPNVVEKIKEGFSYLEMLKNVECELQESVPDIFVWLVADNKRMAYKRLKPEDLLYSWNDAERGINCGQKQMFQLRVPGQVFQSGSFEISAQVTAYIWLGLTREMPHYLDGLSKGYVPNISLVDVTSPDYLPPTIVTYKEVHAYELRCHIAQGRALLATDDSGLTDPSVRVLFNGQSRQTHIIKQSVNPVWNECLLIDAAVIYGCPKDVQSQPPHVVCQVYDENSEEKGTCFEYIGEAELLPVVKLADEPYRRPLFPPSLHWVSVRNSNTNVGELLLSIELIHLGAKMTEYPPIPPVHADDPHRYSLSPAIMPKLIPFRIEAFFWGLRQLKPINVGITIEKPKVEIEIGGYVLKSEEMEKYRKHPNFTKQIQAMDVMLPANPLYRPPMCIRCMENRAFGRTTLIGTNVLSTIEPFLYNPGGANAKTHQILHIDDNAHDDDTDSSSSNDVESEGGIFQVELPHELLVLEKEHGTLKRLREEENALRLRRLQLPIDNESHAAISIDEREGSVRGSDQISHARSDSPTDDIGSQSTLTDFPRSPFPPIQEDLIPSLVSLDSPRTSKDRRQSRTPSSADDDVSVVGSHASKRRRQRTIDLKAMADDGVFDVEEELLIEHLEEETLGSRHPLHSIKSKNEDEESKKKTQRRRQQAQKTPHDEPPMMFDWWCKYHASFKDREEVLKEEHKAHRRLRKTRKEYGKVLKRMWRMTALKALDSIGSLTNRIIVSDDKKKRRRRNAKKYRLKQISLRDAFDKKLVPRLALYENELEDEYEDFFDVFRDFRLHRGRKQVNNIYDDMTRYCGSFKGALRVSRIESSENIGVAVDDSLFFSRLPNPAPLEVLVRCYIVKANNLRPMDMAGRADPYVRVTLGKTKRGDNTLRVNNSLNPTYGKCFELEGILPADFQLNVQILDYDRLGTDKLMGETNIDIEQRVYSNHRALCGLGLKYEKKGWNTWRDAVKPSKLLADLATKYDLRGPYYKPGQVLVGDIVFCPPKDDDEEFVDSEQVALFALRHWDDMPAGVGCRLVEEHVENRSLVLPDFPGVEQGTLDMWLDIFIKDSTAKIPAHVDITPRQAKVHELRVVVWKTKGVPVSDYNPITGSSVDQYVKGYIFGPNVDAKKTETHFRSMSGTGKFHYRLVFRFKYMDVEEKVLLKTKAGWYSLVEHEEKIDPKLTLEVWDADQLSADDYLGRLSLPLTRFPRGTKSSRMCDLDVVDGKRGIFCDLFTQRHIAGWYPFTSVDEEGQPFIAGKAYLEFNLLSEEEADRRPAGEGHNPPEKIPEPERAEMLFASWAGPMSFVLFTFWDRIKWKLLVLLIVTAIVLFFAAFIYQLPASYGERLVYGS